jgi:hypothetical protein
VTTYVSLRNRLSPSCLTLLHSHLARLTKQAIMSVNAPAPENPELVVSLCCLFEVERGGWRALEGQGEAVAPAAAARTVKEDASVAVADLSLLSSTTDPQDQRFAHHLQCPLRAHGSLAHRRKEYRRKAPGRVRLYFVVPSKLANRCATAPSGSSPRTLSTPKPSLPSNLLLKAVQEFSTS